jgi:ribonucleoside-diphosphate reductase alpha chain
MEAPLAFAKRHRALGIGTLGEHTYFQEKKIPFTSILANSHRTIIYKDLFEKAKIASTKLANIFGPCNVNAEFGVNMRHTTLMAVAPTTTNALICGDVSPGIEPLISNVFQRKVAKGSFTKRNPTLEKVLEVEYEKNDADTWDSIISNFGSVQHLEWMSDEDKEVFKTAFEINQYGLIQAASIRQKFIDQSQSLNLFVLPNVSAKDRSRLCITAYKYGIKTLYYQRSLSSLQEGKSQEQITTYFQSTSNNAFDASCTSCEG